MLVLLLSLRKDQVSVGLGCTAHATLLGGGGQRTVRVVVLNRGNGLMAWDAHWLPTRVRATLGCESHRLGLIEAGREGDPAEHLLGDLLRSLHLLLGPIRRLQAIS